MLGDAAPTELRLVLDSMAIEMPPLTELHPALQRSQGVARKGQANCSSNGRRNQQIGVYSTIGLSPIRFFATASQVTSE